MLPDLLTPERVKVPLASRSMDAAVRELVQLAMPSADATARDTVGKTVLERELLLSIGSGSAIPHMHTNPVVSLVLAATETF